VALSAFCFVGSGYLSSGVKRLDREVYNLPQYILRILDKITSEVIKELEISGVQDVRSKHKQNWTSHIERMDNTRLPKHALN
jgi:hypothetical protein